MALVWHRSDCGHLGFMELHLECNIAVAWVELAKSCMQPACKTQLWTAWPPVWHALTLVT